MLVFAYIVHLISQDGDTDSKCRSVKKAVPVQNITDDEQDSDEDEEDEDEEEATPAPRRRKAGDRAQYVYPYSSLC